MASRAEHSTVMDESQSRGKRLFNTVPPWDTVTLTRFVVSYADLDLNYLTSIK